MRTKYFNDGLIGNQNIKASFTKTGEMIRLLYGAADYKQFLDSFHIGLKVNDSAIIYLHNDVNNIYSQEYVENTNILETKIYNSYFKFRVIQTDFVPVDERFLVKNYVIKNENEIDLDINLLVYSKILTNLNNDTSGYVKENALIQYNHDFSVCTFSKNKLLDRQINGAINNFMTGKIGGKDYIGMSPDSAISYDLNKVKPGEETSITLFVYINKNKETDVQVSLNDELDRIRNLDVENLKNETINYWRNFLNEHDILEINKKDINDKIKKIYNRTILLFPLLINQNTGGISAGIEVDEDKTKCGRYSYCWPRDAVFITEALDIVGMKDVSDKFYSKFCQMTQNKNGMWEQRYFTDGRLAPCWGYQIDETASVIFGAYAHYKFTRDKMFLKENLKMLENAITFLQKYSDDILQNKNKMQKSYDLWEEFEGISLYSVSSIFSAYRAMVKVYCEVKELYENNPAKLEFIEKQIDTLKARSEEIKEYCIRTFYDDYKKSYVRNQVDKKIDISIVGAIVPFKMFTTTDPNIYNTIEKINMTLRTYTGGYIRYEDDGYMGGYSPWPIATLWMSWYYLEAGDIEKSIETFLFVVNSASEHGLLGEQVNNDAMKPSWVIGLTWSHAMYIIMLEKLLEKGVL